MSDWNPKSLWIGGDNLFRRDFFLQLSVKSAILRIAGLGYFELYINGNKIGNQVLSPAQTDYDCRVFYFKFTIEDYLRNGKNTIGVMLGEGFFAQSKVTRAYGWGDPYGKKQLRLQLDITFVDDSVYQLVSDSEWDTALGPLIEDNVYAGEVYDARKEISGWSEPVPQVAEIWTPAVLLEPPGGEMQKQELEPCRPIRAISPLKVTYPDADTAVFDLGENIAGWARIKVHEQCGTRIELRFAEEIDDNGHLDHASTGVFATHCVQTDVYICRGGINGEIWEPRFTYHGFRFVSMTGWSKRPEVDNLTGIVVHSDVAVAGGFESDNEFLNNLYQIARRTLLSNLHGVPTDCPARERCGWLGDVQSVAEFAMCNFNMAKYWRKYMDDINTSSMDGIPTMIAPGRRRCGIAAPAWGSTVIQLPWYLYLYYGDEQTLSKHYALMQRWVKHLSSQATNYIVNYGLGDWCPPGTVHPQVTPVALTSTAYYYYDVLLLGQIATIMGLDADAGEYTALANSIKTTFRQNFYKYEDNSFGSQTADAFALFLGLVPRYCEQATADALAKNIIEKYNGHFSTGIIGLKYLFGELCRYGYEDLALETIRKSGYPGFADIISQGATTLWETWEKEPLDEPRPRSRNHPMQAGFAAWYHQSLCGIKPMPDKPGFRHILINPCFPSPIKYASTWQDCKFGKIESSWKRLTNAVEMKIIVPDSCHASFSAPPDWQLAASNRELPAGKHKFIIRKKCCNVLKINPLQFQSI